MTTPDYYYVIIGGGLAGLQLALRLHQDVFFKGKKIAIIEPSNKSINDKTWCFWEEGRGSWDHLITKKWKKGKFISSEITKDLDLDPYSYKMLRSLDFYEYAKEKLETSENIFFIKDKITKIDQVTRTAIGEASNYTATHFFDSRPPSNFEKDEKSSIIYQHFKGIKIKTEKAHFNPDVFTMMDYRIKHKDNTCFTYILPTAKNEALIEFTFFTPSLTDEKVYDDKIEQYIRSILKIDDYGELESEKGIIPMTDYPFHDQNSKYITKIGTAGGWVKASSGYSFKNTERKIDKLIDNIKSGLKLSANLMSKKYQFYDAIFLDVLEQRNDLGESLFTKLYTKNSIQDIFRFLDEETSFSEELKIMLSLYHAQFLKSFFRKI
ncbi:lycopene cyclase family protein [Christiangramia forsetii]|uniref:Lycopene cyclase n=2 Tax=Christiangramia forsetii TaxID=411153 RepID=A0M4B3_CHRFK|nr:lycopene cyclase family protein [Christiangramia forsetii]GGG23803.1 lycopene cyclase [Christiangramia forsetii]CAL67458.1 lycopene cyclase [Christiangramia forsetii KT0803]